jgi:hypothetical protein
MLRIRAILLGLLAMLAVSAVASATASAELQGPWWRHIENSQQAKYALNAEQQLKAKNEGNFKLRSKIAGEKALIECLKVTSKGWLWDGLHQGENEAEEVKFTECTAKTPIVTCTEGVTVGAVKNAYSELMWKYRGAPGELTEVGQQKIYDAFGVAENTEHKFIYNVITLAAPCPIHETFPVVASGTKQVFQDQHQVEHEITWGTAALVEPQNEDQTKGFLTWTIPNQTKLHHQGKEVIATLKLGEQPAELEGKLAVELNNGERFGAFNE